MPTGRLLRGRRLTVTEYLRTGLAAREIILTFDDGPGNRTSAHILATLKLFDAPAAFMMVGVMAERYPADARAIASSGHLIGSHTYSHPNLSRMEPEAALAEIDRGVRAIEATLAPRRPSRVFRTPYLMSTEQLAARVVEAGYTELPADCVPQDFEGPPGAWVRRALSQLEQTQKGLLVLHDIQWNTVMMLPKLLVLLRDRGYSVVQLVEG